MSAVRIGDVGFRLTETGGGDPLLLIHGTGGHGDTFRLVTEPLSRQFRVITYDRRGHAGSVAPPHPRDGYYAAHARDALELLKALRASPAAVLGWSAGGIVALHLALLEPAAVRRLVLYEPPLHVSRHMDFATGMRFLKTLLLGALGFRRAAARNFFRMALGFASGGNGFDRLPEQERERLLANAPALLAELGAGTGEELGAEALERIRCPVTLIAGGNSPRFLAGASDRLAGLMPRMPVLRVPQAGHMLQVEDPGAFVDVARRALA